MTNIHPHYREYEDHEDVPIPIQKCQSCGTEFPPPYLAGIVMECSHCGAWHYADTDPYQWVHLSGDD